MPRTPASLHAAPSRPSALARALVALLFAALLLARGRTVTTDCIAPFGGPAAATADPMPGMGPMDWFANHPARGANALAAPTDSFLVSNFNFDENHDGATTQVDTARVVQGDVILWKWVSGSHTITNGTGSSDPNAGALFDQPISSGAPSFSFQFNTVGTFPFFCRIHESFGMRGVVVVTQNLAGVGAPPAPAHDGFLAPPSPNPAHGATTIRFALAHAGHARVTVLDAQGRRVATPLDAGLAAGSFEARWDAHDDAGGAVSPGVYFVRLELPGASQTRRVTIVR